MTFLSATEKYDIYGTTVTCSRAKAAVTSTGMGTELGKIAEEVTAVKTEKSPLEKRTEEIGSGSASLLWCMLSRCGD